MRVGSFFARHGLAPIVAGAALGIVSAAAPAGAANKEHQQMMAEIRMLQEQNAQLQQSIGTLVDALKTVTTKLDEQAATTRKTSADSRLLIEGLSGELRVVREKIDDSHVRLGSLAQEVDALRNSIPQGPPPGAAIDPNAPPQTSAPPGSPTGATGTPAAGSTGPAPIANAGPPSNLAPGMSPGRLWDMAFSDYAAGQWPLAIQGFETYMRAFPRSEQADDAQFYIGEAYQLDGKMREALAAYERVAADYPQSNRAADSYYKRGVIYNTLNQPDKAKEMFEKTIQLFPNSESSRLAKQLLDARPRRD
jgi:tol-pal system protein YbgF